MVINLQIKIILLAAIYIIRDPSNVITSIANHYQITTRNAFKFMKDKNRGIIEKEKDRYTGFQPLLSWDLHVKSWTKNTLYPTLIIKYEDLIKILNQHSKKFWNFKIKLQNQKKY